MWALVLDRKAPFASAASLTRRAPPSCFLGRILLSGPGPGRFCRLDDSFVADVFLWSRDPKPPEHEADVVRRRLLCRVIAGEACLLLWRRHRAGRIHSFCPGRALFSEFFRDRVPMSFCAAATPSDLTCRSAPICLEGGGPCAGAA